MPQRKPLDERVKEQLRDIEIIISRNISDSDKLDDIKVRLNDLNDVVHFRVNKMDLEATKAMIQEMHDTYTDFLKIEDESKRIKVGVEVVLEFKEIKTKLHEIEKSNPDTKVTAVAKSGIGVADAYLSIVYNEACGITY